MSIYFCIVKAFFEHKLYVHCTVIGPLTFSCLALINNTNTLQLCQGVETLSQWLRYWTVDLAIRNGFFSYALLCVLLLRWGLIWDGTYVCQKWHLYLLKMASVFRNGVRMIINDDFLKRGCVVCLLTFSGIALINNTNTCT